MQLPVFISGFRSGTTLLANLMGLHPDLAAWFETKELCEILRWQHVITGRESAEFESAYCVPPQPDGFSLDAVSFRAQANINDTFGKLAGRKASGKAEHERYPLGFDCIYYTREEAVQALADWQQTCGDGSDYARLCKATGRFINTLGQRHSKAAGKPHWVNKTPEIGRFASELRESIGPCRMIYLIRDGLQVTASGLGLGWADVQTLAFNWKGLLQRTRIAMQSHPDHYLEVRYEDLVRFPAETLASVLQFAGIQTGAGQVVEDFRSVMGADAFNTDRLGNATGLAPEHVAQFMAVAGDLYAELDYPAC